MRLAYRTAIDKARGGDFVRLRLFSGSAGHWRAQVAVNHPRKLWGFKSLPAHSCRLSGHRSRLWQDIVRWPRSTEGLVVASRVEGQGPEQHAVVGDDADVRSGDEELDFAVLMGSTDRNVSQSAEVAQGDFAEGVDFVAADAMVGGGGWLGGSGLDE